MSGWIRLVCVPDNERKGGGLTLINLLAGPEGCCLYLKCKYLNSCGAVLGLQAGGILAPRLSDAKSPPTLNGKSRERGSAFRCSNR